MRTSSATIEPSTTWSRAHSRPLKYIWDLLFRRTTLTLFDQAVVSAANFLTSAMIGKFAGADALGVYALVFSLSMMLVAVTESLVCLPYTILFRQVPTSARRRYAGSTLAQVSLIAILATPLLLLSGIAASFLPAVDDALPVAMLVFAGAAPMIILRDYGRRISLAHLRPQIALAIDIVTSVTQVGALLALYYLNLLTASTALLSIGVGCGIASVGWLWISRDQFEFRRRRLRFDTDRNWKLGSWLFASQMCYVVNMYCLHWLIASKLGAEATGLFVGCTTVVLLCNPFILGMHNALSPRIADALSTDGNEGFRRVIVESTIVLATFMGLFCVIMAVIGERLTVIIFNESYAGQYDTLVLFAIAMLVVAIGMPVDHALWVKHRPRTSVLAGVLGLCVTFVTTWLCLPVIGITGAACGLLAGNTVGTACRWGSALRLGLTSEAGNA